MKLKLLAGPVLALALAGGLAACSTTAMPGQPPASVHQVATKAMLAAETAFNVSATAELDAKSVGLLTGDNAVKADATRKQAYAVLVGLRAVYAAGQSPDLASLLVLTNQLLVLVGKTPVPVPTVVPVPTLQP